MMFVERVVRRGQISLYNQLSLLLDIIKWDVPANT